jgi:hypothetical protein
MDADESLPPALLAKPFDPAKLDCPEDVESDELDDVAGPAELTGPVPD